MSIDKRLISTGAAAGCTTDKLDIFGGSSCVALYGLNYDASDAGGNYNGTPTNVTFNAPGYIDYAASFTHSSSYIEIPSSTSPLGFINSNFTYSMWVKPENYTENDLIGNWNTGTSSNNQFLMIYNNKLRMHLKGAAIGDSTGSISTNAWNHVIVTIDYTNGQGKYYINGSLDSTKTISTTPPSVSAATALFIGKRNATTPKYGGDIDQLRIFNKALSAAEVTTLYGETSCEYTCTTDTNGFPASASSNLVAYYKLDNDATDDTGSYNGTATNVTFDGGRYGASAVFNGSSSGISLPSVNLGSNFSMSVWYKWSGTDNNYNGTIIGSNDENPSIIHNLFSTLNEIVYECSGGGLLLLSSVTANVWYHIAISHDGTSLKGYVNGELTDEDTVNSITATIEEIGYDQNQTRWISGSIDQVRLYDKALSAAEVSTIYEDEHQCYITVDSTDPFGDGDNIALYEFENNANDSTGSHNGTASGVTYSTDSIIGTYSANFDGSGDYVTISATSTTPLDFSTENFTISHWVYPHNTAESAIYSSKWSTGAAALRSYYFGHNASGNILISENPGGGFTSTATITQNAWNHVVYVRNATTAYIYINGSLDSTHSRTNTIDQAGTQNIYFGRVQGTPSGDMYDGLMDQTRYFDRALNGDEVWKLYAEGAKG
jgi:hypothetical protein